MTNKPFCLATTRLVFALVGVAGLVGQINVFATKHLSLVDLFSYFTVESNILVIIILLLLAFSNFTGKDSEKLSIYRGAATLYIVMTGIVYFLLLRGTNSQVTVPWVNVIMHYLLPAGMLADWIFFPPLERIKYKKALLWLTFPILYAVISLIRGYYTGWYPYAFLNPAILGYPLVIIATVCVGVAFAGLAYLLLLVFREC